jgi:hypothetical protein
MQENHMPNEKIKGKNRAKKGKEKTSLEEPTVSI